MTNPLLRIVLAMYLAIWSPALCCCGVKAAIGQVTRISAGRCGEQVMAATPVAAETEALPSCCAHRQKTPEKSQTVGDVRATNQCAQHPASPCRCHDAVDTKVRLDTGAKIVLPALGKADFAQAIMFALPASVIDTIVPAIARSDQRRIHPPSLTTLLSQRCLLLI